MSVIVALSIVGLWTLSWIGCTEISIDWSNCDWLVLAIAVRTWLYTGLFITTHDAIHHSISPWVFFDRAIGWLCAMLYGGFNYQQLAIDHHLHHQYPASNLDPDFHRGDDRFWRWYYQFMREHLAIDQLGGLSIVTAIYVSLFHLSIDRLILFWIVPALLSSLQLFYFGTFLPHREPIGGYASAERTTTIPLPLWQSLITCYHFGYHQEHHRSPQTPWWLLPRLYRGEGPQ
jgi:beta-carotene/zeaxanthin 4-ketolase